MEMIVIVIVAGVLVFGFGALFGAGVQDRIGEEQRRRLISYRREMEASLRNMRDGRA